MLRSRRVVQYHQAVEKLLLLVFGPLVFAAVLLVIITGVRRVIVSFKSRPTPEQIKVAQEAYLGRLLNPQADAVERELGKVLPERLLRLYADRSALQSVGFKVEKPGKKRWRRKRWPVYCFEPMDIETLNELPYEDELGPGFCFATTGRGCWYWIAASDKRTKDSPVIFLDYDGSGSHGETVADSLDEFLSWRRLPL
jgi:SMI1/KNR4 family protein SUKH-1